MKLRQLKQLLLTGAPAGLAAFEYAQNRKITVGLIPSEDSRAMIAQSQAMIDQLSAALGMPVKAFVASHALDGARGRNFIGRAIA